jgi:hypothetical protein
VSRGNPNALFTDWPIILALDAFQLVMFNLVILFERLEVILSQGLGLLLSCCGATVAGAFIASKRAHGQAKAETAGKTG